MSFFIRNSYSCDWRTDIVPVTTDMFPATLSTLDRVYPLLIILLSIKHMHSYSHRCPRWCFTCNWCTVVVMEMSQARPLANVACFRGSWTKRAKRKRLDRMPKDEGWRQWLQTEACMCCPIRDRVMALKDPLSHLLSEKNSVGTASECDRGKELLQWRDSVLLINWENKGLWVSLCVFDSYSKIQTVFP